MSLHDPICATHTGGVCNCPSAAFDNKYTNGPVTFELDEVFYLNGIEWITTSQTGTFIIATRTDIIGEPTEATDIIQVNKL